MYSFNNDYSEGACPEILKALIENNFIQEDGYGLDNFCLEATEIIKEKTNHHNIDVHFVPGGTPCNILAVVSCLKSYEAVIAVETAHINVHETGAIEASGHKILTCKGNNGKITPKEIEEIFLNRMEEHMVYPKMVFISNATELGTIYSYDELKAIREMCDKYDLYLYMDGARLSSALVSIENDLSLANVAELTDMFYLGGTKNGALLGEAFIIKNPELKENFRYHLKQRGQMLAKSRIMGIEFKVLLNNDLHLELAKHANKMAQTLKMIFAEADIPFLVDTSTNQIFPILPNKMINELKKEYKFEIWEKYDDENSVARFVCSWDTKKDKILQFYNDFKRIRLELMEL